jgi:type I restriction enzyme S subunit
MAGEARLADLCEAITDCPHSTPVWTESGSVVLRNQNIRNGRLDLSESSYTDEAHFAERTRRARPTAGDLVITREAPMGEVCMIPPGLRCCLGQRMVLLRPNRQHAEPRYLLYALQSKAVQHEIRVNEGTGSTVSNLRIPLLESLRIPLRPLDEQRAIAHTLGTLDDKIELNHRMTETLEAMAKAIFKSWFVDLGPARAKAADLIETGILEIGDGYRAKNSELSSPGLPFIRAGNLSNEIDTRGAEVLHESSVAQAKRKVSRAGDVAFTSKGTIGRFARVTQFTEQFVYSPQVCFWRSLDPKRLEPAILYCWMRSEDFKAQIEAVAGQTDMAPYVSLRDQYAMEMPLFPDSQEFIARCLDVLLARKALAVEETRTLAALRDAVLPRLLSGEIRLKDVERLVEAVT